MRGVEEYFGPLGTVQLAEGRNISARDLEATDVLLVRSITKVQESLLEGSAVKFVGTATSGYDHIDTDFLTRSNIGFSYAPGSNANSVVEYVFAAISAVEGKLESLIGGQTLGIIGYGNIGRALVTLCEQLGIPVLVYDPWLEEGLIPHRASLAQVLDCEVITLHTSLIRESPWPSYHLIDEEALAQIPKSSLLINASRGEVVDNTALLTLCSSGSSPSCVLDVWEGEPELSSALLKMMSLGTAHIAGYSLESKFLATRMLRDAVIAHFDLAAPPGELQTAIATGDEIKVPPELESAELLRWAFSARYNILEDDSLLRSAVENSVTPIATGFDALRKTYRVRRELRGSIVRLHPQAASSQTQLLRSLGCLIGQERY